VVWEGGRVMNCQSALAYELSVILARHKLVQWGIGFSGSGTNLFFLEDNAEK